MLASARHATHGRLQSAGKTLGGPGLSSTPAKASATIASQARSQIGLLQVLKGSPALSAHTRFCPVASSRRILKPLQARSDQRLSSQSARQPAKGYSANKQRPHQNRSRSGSSSCLRTSASSTPAADSGSSDGGSGSQGPPNSLKKAGEEEPEDDDLELLSLSQVQPLDIGARCLQLPVYRLASKVMAAGRGACWSQRHTAPSRLH